MRRALSLAHLESSSLDPCIKSDAERAPGSSPLKQVLEEVIGRMWQSKALHPLPWSLECTFHLPSLHWELPKDTASK